MKTQILKPDFYFKTMTVLRVVQKWEDVNKRGSEIADYNEPVGP